MAFALRDTRRSTLIGNVSSFSIAEFYIPFQGQAVALLIESLLPGPRDNPDRGRHRPSSSQSATETVSSGLSLTLVVEWSTGGLVRDDLPFRPPSRRPPIPGVTRRGGDYVVS